MLRLLVIGLEVRNPVRFVFFCFRSVTFRSIARPRQVRADRSFVLAVLQRAHTVRALCRGEPTRAGFKKRSSMLSCSGRGGRGG